MRETFPMAVELRESVTLAAGLFPAMKIETYVFLARRRTNGLRNSASFRLGASNSAYSIVEYVAQPEAMLLAAPFLVGRLGLSQYGVWMLVSAILGSVGILSTGFGDATVKYVSTYLALDDFAGIERTIRATLTINIVSGRGFAGDHDMDIRPFRGASGIRY